MKARVVWAALGIAVLAVAFATSSALVYRLLFVIIAVPLIGYAGTVLAVRGLAGEVRRLTPFLQVGGSLDEELVLHSRHWWPKLLLEAEHRSEPFGAGGRVVTLWPYQSVRWTVRKHCERRGLYQYGEMDVTSRDPLGLFQRQVRVGEPQTALIYPATVEIPGFFIPSGRGWTEGVVTGKTFSRSPVTSSVREYTPGDSMNHIHWPMTARAGKLMVKEFEPEPAGPADAVWVLLDLHERVQAGEGSESTVEYGVTVAASVAKRFLDSGRNVGIAIGGAEQVIIRPGSGLAQLGWILETLALVQEGGEASLMDIASAVGTEMTQAACAVIVSPSPVGAVSAASTVLQSHGGTVVPVLLEAGSFAGRPPERGETYRLPGTALNAYVIHRGDEIERRLDHRVHGGGQSHAHPMGAVR
ncbi:MAG: DUF58 domain-containing protein [Dehalococcoidia bacterium]